jgi:hypothetical protein
MLMLFMWLCFHEKYAIVAWTNGKLEEQAVFFLKVILNSNQTNPDPVLIVQY